MTEQCKKLNTANFIISELYRDKPFTLTLDADHTAALYQIASESHHLHSEFVNALAADLQVRAANNWGFKFVIADQVADVFYHMLSSYVAKCEGVKS